MNFAETWKFHSIGVITEDKGLVYMTAEEYLASPITYIDESDPDAAENEMRQRKLTVGGCMEICDDGKLYMLLPYPEGVTQEEIDEAVKSGEITVKNGLICSDAIPWENRNGELWYDSGIEGEAFGEKTDPWISASTEEGFLTFMTTRYVKEEA